MNPDPMPPLLPETAIHVLNKSKSGLGKVGFVIAAVPWIFFLMIVITRPR